MFKVFQSESFGEDYGNTSGLMAQRKIKEHIRNDGSDPEVLDAAFRDQQMASKDAGG